jgi:hypothetical protein
MFYLSFELLIEFIRLQQPEQLELLVGLFQLLLE